MPKREKYTGSFLGRESKTKIQSGGGKWWNLPKCHDSVNGYTGSNPVLTTKTK